MSYYHQVLQIVKDLEPFYVQEPFIDAGDFYQRGRCVRANLYFLTEELADFWYKELRRNEEWDVEEPWWFINGDKKMRLQFYVPITEGEYVEWIHN